MATIWIATVADGGNDANPGTEISPKATFASAYSIAVNGDTIRFKAGSYTDNFVNSITKELTILGPNDGISPNTGVDLADENPARLPEAIITTNGSHFIKRNNTSVRGLSFVRGTSPAASIFFLVVPQNAGQVIDNASFKYNKFYGQKAVHISTSGLAVSNFDFSYNRYINGGEYHGGWVVQSIASGGGAIQDPIVEYNYANLFATDTPDHSDDVQGFGLDSSVNAICRYNTCQYGMNHYFAPNSSNALFTDNVSLQPMGWTWNCYTTTGTTTFERNRMSVDAGLRPGLTWWGSGFTANQLSRVAYFNTVPNLTFADNEIDIYGIFTDTNLDSNPQAYGISALVLRGATTGSITGNKISASSSAKSSAGFDLSSAVLGMTAILIQPTVPDITGPLLITGNTITGYFHQCVAVYDFGVWTWTGSEYAQTGTPVWGNLVSGSSVIIKDVVGNPNIDWGGKSAIGEIIDMRDCNWGDFSGPSGGAVDPVSGAIANGAGSKVSSYIRFAPYKTVPYNGDNEINIEGLTEDAVFGIGRNASKFSDGGIPSIIRNNTAGINRGPLVIVHSTGGVTPKQAAQGIGGHTGQIGYKYDR